MRKSLVRLLIASALILPAPLFAQAGPVPISLDDAVRQAHANSPLMVQAVGQSRVADAQYKARLAAFLPSLQVGQGTSHNIGQVYVQGVLLSSGGGWSSNQYYYSGLTIFNGGQNVLDYRAAKASLDAADQSQVIQSFTLSLNVKQQYFAVLAYREAVAAAEQSLKEAEEQMAVTEARCRYPLSRVLSAA